MRVHSTIRNLSPKYAGYFSNESSLVQAIVANMLTVVRDGNLTDFLQAESQDMNAVALFNANVTSANVSYIPIPSVNNDIVSSVYSMEKLGSTIIAVIVFASIVGLLFLAIVVARYSKLLDGQPGGRAFYTITQAASMDSINELDESGFSRNVFHASPPPELKRQIKIEKREIIHTPQPKFEKEDKITIYDAVNIT